MKALTVNVGLKIEGEDDFINLLTELISHKKSVNFLPDRSIWDYEPETNFLSVTQADLD